MVDGTEVRSRPLPSTGLNGKKVVFQRVVPGEEWMTLAQAAKLLPRVDGRKVAVSTLWRWCSRGLRGVFLAYVRVGRKICTTREALLRFFSELTERDRQVPSDRRCQPRLLKRRPITSKQRLRSLAEADAILERARI